MDTEDTHSLTQSISPWPEFSVLTSKKSNNPIQEFVSLFCFSFRYLAYLSIKGH